MEFNWRRCVTFHLISGWMSQPPEIGEKWHTFWSSVHLVLVQLATPGTSPTDVQGWLNPPLSIHKFSLPRKSSWAATGPRTSLLSSPALLHASEPLWQALSYHLIYFCGWISRIKDDSGNLSPGGLHPAVSSLGGGAPHHPLQVNRCKLWLCLLHLPILECLTGFFSPLFLIVQARCCSNTPVSVHVPWLFSLLIATFN